MKFVIFADKSYNYIRPISDGLKDTLSKMGHDVEIYYDGQYWLHNLNLFKVLLADVGRFFQNLKAGASNLYLYRFGNLLTFNTSSFRENLETCDAIIVTYNCPSAYYNDTITRIEGLREKYHKPIILYDFHYLPNQGWYKRILDRNLNNYGLERFDWYLLISIVTEFAIPKEIPEIYSLIGMDVRKSNLYPEKNNEFTVLLDFPRADKKNEREQLKMLLEKNSIHYIELSGRYTTEQIRSIYRKCNAYFPSTRESFGLPIAELQLCGCAICVPSASWLPAHYIDKDKMVIGNGHLGSNFYVFNSESDLLNIFSKLKNINRYDLINNFIQEYPLYYSIDRKSLNEFINKLKSGEINYTSHLGYKKYNQYISLIDDYLKS